ncbi:uncharacterized protein [Eurosta solidaginis]|uniref:uncharacterized protein n=1 Tax=Eurosta solidaginis TaxID=178769 RepID=UPI0035305735
MESGKNKISTKDQIERLIELMERHPEVGRGKPQFGCSQNRVKELWEEFALELNSLGPPTRTAPEWTRVWVHYKANLKRKLSNNRNNLVATGGGPSHEKSLSPLEESVAQLIQIRSQVAPSGRAFGTENMPPASDDEEHGNTMSAAASTTREPTGSNAGELPTPSGSRNRRRGNVETERLELLTKQTETQKKLLKKIDRLERTAHKMQKVNEKLLEIKQKKYLLYKKQAQEASELCALKAEIAKLKIKKLSRSTNM